jgi:hypothetical protein
MPLSPADELALKQLRAPKEVTRAELLARLSERVRNAFQSYEYAVGKQQGQRLTARQAYEWLVEQGLPDQLAGYSLPNLDTWERYLRKARLALGEQKNTPRAGRPHGRSVVRQDEIEHSEDDG